MTQPSFRLKRPEPGAEVRFSFNGRELSGLAGEPLSAALLANGIHLVGRSFKYHRPRGIVSSGVEEPSALLQVGTGARITPNLPATEVRLYEGLTARSQNCYPSVAFDLGAINRLVAPFIPAGFYYKTFMGPRPDSWMFYERFIRRAAGLGIAPIEDDPDEYDQTHHHCDVLVVGAGPAGMAAALTAGRSGLRVLLVERQPEPGGSLLAEPPDSSLRIDGQEADRWLRETNRSLRSLANVTVLTGTNVFGRYRHNWYAAVQTLRQPGAPGPGVRERLWKIRAKHVVFATGAIERMLVFANNDLPGVMLAGAVRDYAVRHGVAAGRRVVFIGNNDTIFRAALDCREAGLNVVAVLDIRAAGDNRLSGACRAAGIPVAHRVGHLQASGGRRVSRLRFTSPQGRQSIACDVVGMSAGWAPAIHLHSQLEGALRFDESSGAFLPIVDDGGPYSIGACAGTMDLDAAFAEATTVIDRIGGAPLSRRRSSDPIATTGATTSQGIVEWRSAARIEVGMAAAFVDLQNDVTVKDMHLAIREGMEINEHLKRYCGIGMGTDQGKIGNLNALAIAAAIRGRQPQEIGLTRFRQPFSPVTIGTMVGRHAGPLAHAYRRSPLHELHEKHGAQFEFADGWELAAAFPGAGEDAAMAAEREGASVRSGAVVTDLSSQAKFEVSGRDGLALLDALFFTPLSDLKPGETRRALLLNDNGLIADVCVLWRLAEDRVLLTTGAARGDPLIMLIENTRQNRRREIAAFATDVTDVWAWIAVAGKTAPETVARALPDVGQGLTARPPGQRVLANDGCVLAVRRRTRAHPRIDLLVRADGAAAVWESLLGAGATPGGRKVLTLLKAEEGEPRLGFDIDGTVNPMDVGVIEIPEKNFVGRPSLLRDREGRHPRRELVALEAGEAGLSGCQILDRSTGRPIGYVTTSVIGPTSRRPITYALLEAGRSMVGQRLDLMARDRRIVVSVAPMPIDHLGEGA